MSIFNNPVSILADEDGEIITQDNPLPIKGVVEPSGSTTVEQQRGDGDGTITYADPVVATQVYNDSGDELTLTVNGAEHIVPDRMTYTFRDDANPHTTASITAIGPWFAVGLR